MLYTCGFDGHLPPFLERKCLRLNLEADLTLGGCHILYQKTGRLLFDVILGIHESQDRQLAIEFVVNFFGARVGEVRD